MSSIFAPDDSRSDDGRDDDRKDEPAKAEIHPIKYAGFWVRLCADFLDSLLLDATACLVGLMLLGAIYWVKILFLGVSQESLTLFESLDPFYLQFVLMIIRGILSLIYYVWLTYRYETTLGKRFFRVFVVSGTNLSRVSLKQSWIRCLAYLVSYLPFGCGFLMILFHPEKKGLHDLIANTAVIIRDKKVSTSFVG